jgi:hypothetical protein
MPVFRVTKLRAGSNRVRRSAHNVDARYWFVSGGG